MDFTLKNHNRFSIDLDERLTKQKTRATDLSLQGDAKKLRIAELFKMGIEQNEKLTNLPLFKDNPDIFMEAGAYLAKAGKVDKASLETFLFAKVRARASGEADMVRGLYWDSAEYLVQFYKRHTEQFYQTKDGEVFYFPSDAFLRIAAAHVESYVQRTKSTLIRLKAAWDPHYVEAVALYCSVKGYTCTQDTGWELQSSAPRSEAFKELYQERFAALDKSRSWDFSSPAPSPTVSPTATPSISPLTSPRGSSNPSPSHRRSNSLSFMYEEKKEQPHESKEKKSRKAVKGS